MPVKYKLIYFNFRWIAEPVRYILSYVGEPFEDIRLSWDDWEKDASIKKDYPYGKLPVLEEMENGFKLSQSFAMVRYLGTKYNLAGTSAQDAAKCDEYASAVTDMLKDVELMWPDDKDPKKIADAKANCLTKTLPRFLAQIEQNLKKNGGEYLVGKGLSYADFLLAHYTETFEIFVQGDILDNYPTIKAHQKKIFDIPQIKEWIGKRPKTEF